MDSPIPLDPPVISATFPSSLSHFHKMLSLTFIIHHILVSTLLFITFIIHNVVHFYLVYNVNLTLIVQYKPIIFLNKMESK